MPRKVNRRKYKRYQEQSAPSASASEPPSPPESLFKRIISKANYLLNKHPYVIFIIPIMYEFYNSYKTSTVDRGHSIFHEGNSACNKGISMFHEGTSMFHKGSSIFDK